MFECDDAEVDVALHAVFAFFGEETFHFRWGLRRLKLVSLRHLQRIFHDFLIVANFTFPFGDNQVVSFRGIEVITGQLSLSVDDAGGRTGLQREKMRS